MQTIKIPQSDGIPKSCLLEDVYHYSLPEIWHISQFW